MHVSAFPFDLSHPLIQFIFTAFVIVVGILHLVKTTASKYFVVDANFEEGRAAAGGERERLLLENRFKNRDQMVAVAAGSGDGCAVCGKDGAKQCSRCRRVRYCSTACQSKHWKEGHNKKCQELKSFGGLNGALSASSSGANASICDSKSGKALQQLKKVLFPYEDFVKLFNWENGGFRPSGLLNCGNSCYANVVLQCLSCTRPLVAYLLEIGHVGKCKRNDWCFLCELQIHVARVRNSWQPFSPLNILSRLPNIGGNLGYGKQEDAHEFMRFAIDTMQSVCLDEFGGEKALHPSSQETTLIQYIFGGHLQSQVKCSKCNKISYRHENMMDLTVEIQGDAESLEECLDQFTAEEWLDGENMYKCDGCNDYVRACKRLAIHQAPNVLTIALKRFQSGRFGKLNKRVTFPETLDVGPYMSKPGYGTDVYELYAVVVHIDMLNASYFGHYICYTKDFHGNWYRIDDCKVINVELEEVLSQGAYMLLYSRMCVRPSCVKPLETCKEEKQEGVVEAQPYSQAAVETVNTEGPIKSFNTIDNMSTVISTTEEEKQGVDVAEEAHPYLELPDQSTTVEGSLTSVSIIPTAARSPIMELSSEREEAVCMDLDDPVEVNTRFNREDLTVAAGDIFIESESGSPNMDLDGPAEIDLMFARGDQLGLYLDNSESSSFGTRLDCGSKHSDATGTTSVEIYHEGLLTSVPLTEASPSVEARSTGSEASGTNSEDCQFEDGNTTIGSKDSIINEVPVVNSLPNESVIQKLPETSCSFPSSLNSDKKISHGESSSFHSLSKPMFEQVQAVNSANNIPASQNRKGNTLKLTGDRSCSNAKQKPLFSPGFLDKRPRCKSPNKNANVMVKPWEVGTSCKVSSNCNGINKPGGSHISVSRKHDVVVEPVGFVTAERLINSVSTIPTDLRPPTMNLIPEKDDAVCRNFDNPVEVGSRFTREDPAATTAEVPVHSESMSLDLGPDGPTGIDLMSTRGDQLDLDFDYPGSSSLGMKLDDCGSKHSNASGIASPVEIHKGGVRFVNNTPSAQCSKEHIIKSAGDESCCNKSPLGNGKVLVKPGEVGMSCKVVEPGEDCSSESSYAGECGPANIANGIAVSVPLTEAYDLRQELKDPEYALTESFGNGRVDGCNMSASETVGSLPRLMDHQMEEISLNVPAASSSDKEMLDDSNHVIGSQNWQSPDLVQIASVESVHDICASSETEGLSSNMNNGDSCSRSLNSVFSHSSYDEQTRGRFQKRNNAPEGLAEVGSSCKANNYKEFAGHGSLLQNGTQASNYDSKVDRDTSFKTTKLMDNQCEKIYMDEDERMVKEIVEVGDPLRWHCNGNGSCNNFDKMKNCQGESVSWGNGKEVFSPSFLNKPSRKKAKSLKKDDEVSSLGETVSSNHDKNKMPRFG